MPRLGYRPALDGLRGIAITLVILVHAFSWPDGRLGVDLFFVLSGFLITTLLLEERAETGKVSLRDFYLRRARRLLPALGAMVVVYVSGTIAISCVTGRWLAVRHALLGALAAATFSTNFVLERQHAISAATLPIGASLAPLWSLAAEDQFYFLWPPILFLVLRGSRRAAAVLLVGAIALTAARGIELSSSARVTEFRLEFGPDTRGVGILIGCLLGIVYSSAAREQLLRWARFLAPVGAFFAIGLVVEMSGRSLFRGSLASFGLATAVLIANAVDGRSLASRVLAFRPLAALGKVSYSLYLWHEVVFTVFRVNTGHPALPAKLGAIAASVLVAAASYRFVERRFIRRRPLTEGGASRLDERSLVRLDQPLVAGSLGAG